MTVFSVVQDIYLRQGDTGQVTFTGLPKDKNYSVFQSIYNPDENIIIKEIQATSFSLGTGTALFKYNEDFSNSLPVGEWVYGLKICDAQGTEDTILPQTTIENGKLIQKPAPKFTVDYKVIEGS